MANTQLTTKVLRGILGRAIDDALAFSAEFPGEKIAGDWDSEAYQIAVTELKLSDADRDAGWDAYAPTLHAAVDCRLPAAK
jgi:hypothetical protein